MKKDVKRNAVNKHNASITARPAIFFRVETDRPPLVKEILGIEHLYRRREFTSAFFELGTKEKRELEKTVSETDREAFKGLTALLCAYSAPETLGKEQLQAAIKLLIPQYPGDTKEFARVVDARSLARKMYARLLAGKIKGARIIIGTDFAPAVLCPDLKTAMFVFAAYRRVAVCLNCGKLFARDSVRPDDSATEKYCTVACGSRYRQKLYRLRIKRKGKKR